MTGDIAYADRKFATLYLFGRGKSRASDHQKKRKKPRKKMGVTRPRPDGGVITIFYVWSVK